jgi:hypothetical protein
MWHPKNYLHPEVITALLMSGFKPLEIEFLGWLSYTAAALNNSRNPSRAAHTILAKANDEESSMHKMLMTFANRKKDSIRPEGAEKHEVADQVFDDLKWTIQGAITIGALTSNGDDFTQGGISDGEGSITSEDRDNEALVKNDTDEGYDNE